MIITIIFTISMFLTLGHSVEEVHPMYQYNENGRIIIPDRSILDTFPKDGGEYFNRLVFESSPYLLQHAANPVNWYPWGDEAFEAALREDKPIFLSIGYTTCHWCHVMEHESFEDSTVAALMNDAFICIKVDREERPDIDNVYMSVTQMITGRGGWPMTVIMTPDKKPFFAGTYFPKETRGNRIGMMELIPRIQSLWQSDREKLLSDAESNTQRLQSVNTTNSEGSAGISSTVLEQGFQTFQQRFDSEYGGFGSAPKFPKAHDYSFLLRYWKKTGNLQSLAMVEKSLTEMRSGGMYDQIGYGFHRYSTDTEWLVPHFEKMLYDQAILVHAYLDAYLVTGKEEYAQTAREIMDYILRVMTSPEGGFYSAEDADSEGEEGKYYVWTTSEVEDILGEKDATLFNRAFEIKSNGNFRDGYATQTNIPHLTSSLDVWSKSLNIPSDELMRQIDHFRKSLFEQRELRVHPQKDDKILTDWNGLMISAMARAAQVLHDEKLENASVKAMDFILSHLVDEAGNLVKRYRNGVSGIHATVEDYAFVIWGLMEVYELTFDVKYLKKAVELSDYQLAHFWDVTTGGFYFTSDESEELLVRVKEAYDGAIPSGNSVSAMNFLKLGRMLSRPDYEVISTQIFNAFSTKLNRSSSGFSQMLQAIDFSQGPTFEILIAGKIDDDRTIRLINEIRSVFLPNAVMILVDPNDTELISWLPHLQYYHESDGGEPLVYVCQNFTCKLPTSDIQSVLEQLGLGK